MPDMIAKNVAGYACECFETGARLGVMCWRGGS
jgi:hypothetical protein